MKARLAWIGNVRLWWLFGGLLALAVLVGPALRGQLDPVRARGENARLPTGYSAIVERIVGVEGEPLLEVSAAPDESEEEAIVAGRVTLTPAGAQFPGLSRFIDQSFLHDDMASLDPAVWRLDGAGFRLSGVYESAHLLRGPYDQGEAWTGDILFSDQQQERLFVVQGDREAAELAPVATATECSEPLFGKPGQSAGQTAATCGIVRFMLEREAVGSLQRVGNRLMLRVPGSEDVDVDVDGKRVAAAPDGASRSEFGFGSSLHFLDKRTGESSYYSVRQDLPSVSHYIQGRGRQRDPVLANIAKPIEGAMASGRDDVHLTIDSQVQAAAQRQLSRMGRRILAGQSVSFRAAATLMDGKSGDIAALATFPAEPDDLVTRERDLPQRQRLLDQNQNFVPLPIGSTAKVPFAAAILSARPDLLTLRVDGRKSYKSLLGFDLGGEFTDHSDATMGMREFIAYSSNRYAATLMLLGLQWSGNGWTDPDVDAQAWYAQSGALTDGYSIGGHPYRFPPKFDLFRNAAWGVNGAVPQRRNQAQDVWSHNLGSLFGLAYFSDSSKYLREKDVINSPLWRGLQAQRPWLLLPAVPERETFGFDRINDVGSDYVMSILGGNRSRWPTVRLAEAYSRIVARNTVQARLVAGPAEHPGQLPIDSGIRAVLLQGMRDVFLVGTANKMLANPAFPNDLREQIRNGQLWLMGKTGTPDVIRIGTPTPSSIMLSNFAYSAPAACNLHLSSSGRLVVGDGNAIVTIRSCAPGMANQARTLADEVERINRSPTRRVQLRARQDGRVRDIPTASNTNVAEFGKVLVLSAARVQQLPDGSSQFCTTRTIAINFQARDTGIKEPAQELALAMLGERPIREWLMGGCPARTPPRAQRR